MKSEDKIWGSLKRVRRWLNRDQPVKIEDD
jgi:hypothetical protein